MKNNNQTGLINQRYMYSLYWSTPTLTPSLPIVTGLSVVQFRQ